MIFLYPLFICSVIFKLSDQIRVSRFEGGYIPVAPEIFGRFPVRAHGSKEIGPGLTGLRELAA